MIVLWDLPPINKTATFERGQTICNNNLMNVGKSIPMETYMRGVRQTLGKPASEEDTDHVDEPLRNINQCQLKRVEAKTLDCETTKCSEATTKDPSTSYPPGPGPKC